MSILGKILAAPVRLLNVPNRAIEKLIGDDEDKEDRVLSRPLEALAEAIEEAVDEEESRD